MLTLSVFAQETQTSDADTGPDCFDLPGTQVICGSHCWPFCSARMLTFDYNHIVIVPAGKTCYVDSLKYGVFDLFLSKHSKLQI